MNHVISKIEVPHIMQLGITRVVVDKQIVMKGNIVDVRDEHRLFRAPKEAPGNRNVSGALLGFVVIDRDVKSPIAGGSGGAMVNHDSRTRADNTQVIIW